MSTNSNPGSGLWHLEFAEIGPILGVLQKHGVTLAHMARLRDAQNDPEYAQLVAEAFKQGPISSSSQKTARDILGTRFFGPNQWAQYLFTNLSVTQRSQLDFFPWDDGILRSPCPFTPGQRVRDTHVAFAGIPSFCGYGFTEMEMSICGMEHLLLYMHDRLPIQFPLPAGPPSHWYDGQRFWRKTLGVRWHLLFVDEMPDRFEGKTYEEQASMLPAEYEVPSTVEQTVGYVLISFRDNLPKLNYGGVLCSDFVEPEDEQRRVRIEFHDGHIEYFSSKIGPEKGLLGLTGRIGASRKPNM